MYYDDRGVTSGVKYIYPLSLGIMSRSENRNVSCLYLPCIFPVLLLYRCIEIFMLIHPRYLRLVIAIPNLVDVTSLSIIIMNHMTGLA